jgi:hypothetical protein
MKSAALLIVLLSNGGYWFGGHDNTIAVRRALTEQPSAALDLDWELVVADATVAKGSAALGPREDQTTIRLQPPVPRVRVAMRWVYRVKSHETGREVDAGEAAIEMFPDHLLNGMADRFGRDRATLMVCQRSGGGLGRLLSKNKVPFEDMDDTAALKFRHGGVVLVAADVLDESPFAQGPLLSCARDGASVMLFEQTKPQRLAGYPVARREGAGGLTWREDHPLLRGIEPRDLQRWISNAMTLRPVRLPPNEPALEVCYWPPEVPTPSPAPIDALLVSKSVGKGRIVLCQFPLGEWEQDPRSQLLLNAAADYLLTRPQPTPPPSERRTSRPTQSPTIPTITIPPGDTQ